MSDTRVVIIRDSFLYIELFASQITQIYLNARRREERRVMNTNELHESTRSLEGKKSLSN